MHIKKYAQSLTFQENLITSIYILDHSSHYAHLGALKHTNLHKAFQHRETEQSL